MKLLLAYFICVGVQYEALINRDFGSYEEILADIQGGWTERNELS